MIVQNMSALCPYRIGDYLQTENPTNPALSWPGTSWVQVQDRMLKPASDQVKVSLLPDFSSGWTEARPGVRSWKLKVAPGETRRLELGLAVRAPKEGVVTGLED